MIFNKKKDENYFDMFRVLSEFACRAAQMMDALINDYTGIEAKCREIEDLEHEADAQVHKIYDQLNSAFITPIDREDIFLIARRLDQVTDQIDSAAQRFLMFNVEEMTDEARIFSRFIIRCCGYIDGVVGELRHFKKAKRIQEGIRQVNELEHEGDNHYHASVKKLFREHRDPLTVLKWKEVYQALERILDACEDAANCIMSVVMKNT
jgi:uncharacterized protein